MKRLILLFLLAFIFAACKSSSSPPENFFGNAAGFVEPYPISSYLFIPDTGKKRVDLFSLSSSRFEDLVKGEALSEIPFPEGEEYIGGASHDLELLALYGKEETREVYYYDLKGFPFDYQITGRKIDVGIKGLQKVFFYDDKWGLVYSDRIEFYTTSFTPSTILPLGTSQFWKRVKLFGSSLLLIPENVKGYYAVNFTAGTVNFISLTFFPEDAAVTGNSAVVVGGSEISLVKHGEQVKSREFSELWEYADSGSGSVYGKSITDFVALLSGKGKLYFVDKNLCFISDSSPSVKEKFFFDSGESSDPALDVTDFSDCPGDVPDETFTLIFGDIINPNGGYVKEVTSDSCFEANVDFPLVEPETGDYIVIENPTGVETYTLSWWGKSTFCVNGKLPSSIESSSVVVRMNGYALYSVNGGFLGRVDRNGTIDLGYAKIEVKEGDKPVTVGDYFVFSLASGVHYLSFVQPEKFSYYYVGPEVASLPAGLMVDGEKVYAVFSGNSFFGGIYSDTGEIFLGVK